MDNNSLEITNEEILILEKLFVSAGWRNFLLDITKEENELAKNFWSKILDLIEKKKER